MLDSNTKFSANVAWVFTAQMATRRWAFLVQHGYTPAIVAQDITGALSSIGTVAQVLVTVTENTVFDDNIAATIILIPRMDVAGPTMEGKVQYGIQYHAVAFISADDMPFVGGVNSLIYPNGLGGANIGIVGIIDPGSIARADSSTTPPVPPAGNGWIDRLTSTFSRQWSTDPEVNGNTVLGNTARRVIHDVGEGEFSGLATFGVILVVGLAVLFAFGYAARPVAQLVRG